MLEFRGYFVCVIETRFSDSRYTLNLSNKQREKHDIAISWDFTNIEQVLNDIEKTRLFRVVRVYKRGINFIDESDDDIYKGYITLSPSMNYTIMNFPTSLVDKFEHVYGIDLLQWDQACDKKLIVLQKIYPNQ
jgi:hypothetical protein